MVKESLNYLQVHEGLLQGGYFNVVLQMHRGPKEEIDLFHLKKIVLNTKIDYRGMSWNLMFENIKSSSRWLFIESFTCLTS